MKHLYIQRARSIIDNMRRNHSGSDVHDAHSILGSATSLIEALEANILKEEEAFEVLVHIEKRQIEFFKKKFGF